MKIANRMPRPIRISRKLKVSSEKVAVLVSDAHDVIPTKCTKRFTTCGPVHTC